MISFSGSCIPLKVSLRVIKKSLLESLSSIESIVTCPFWMLLIHELRGHSVSVDGAHSLTHSILINLFIKSGLNNFLLPPLLSIVFVQECSVVFRQGGSRKVNIFARQLESLGTSLSNSLYVVFYLSDLLTRR